MIEKCFQTDDGETFPTEAEAKRHEICREAISKLIDIGNIHNPNSPNASHWQYLNGILKAKNSRKIIEDYYKKIDELHT